MENYWLYGRLEKRTTGRITSPCSEGSLAIWGQQRWTWSFNQQLTFCCGRGGGDGWLTHSTTGNTFICTGLDTMAGPIQKTPQTCRNLPMTSPTSLTTLLIGRGDGRLILSSPSHGLCYTALLPIPSGRSPNHFSDYRINLFSRPINLVLHF